MEARLKAAEMWFYRRMLRISWTARISNEEVLERAGRIRELLEVICERQLSFLDKFTGRATWKTSLLQVKLTGKGPEEDRKDVFGKLEREIRWKI